MNKNKFFMQGATLAVLAIVMKSANVLYRSYLSQKIGAEGMGLYQLIFSIFLLAITLSTSGISLAVTRLVSSCIAKGKTAQIRSTVNKCLCFCLILSLSISAVFFFCSDFLATELLGNAQASSCLKILGVGLPFMSVCTCVKGYFLAVDEILGNGLAEVFEQALTIGGTVVIFLVFPFDNYETACLYAMIASTIGEIGSFVINVISLKISLNKNTPVKKEKSLKVMHSMSHIALPCTLSSAVRSLLSSCENLLIPLQLQKTGASYSLAMTQYGLLQGMAIPILYFPSAFIAPFAVLLIPKICKEKELNHKKAVAYVTNKAVCATVSFGIITTSVFYFYGKELGEVFYGSAEAGAYIAIFAPLITLMYLDIVVDALLKGLDQQLVSMKLNIVDASIRVVLILLLMGSFGISAYIAILFFSTIFNASLSLSKLIRVANPKFTFVKKLFYQVPAMFFAIYLTMKLNNFENAILSLAFVFVISYSVYYLICFLFNKVLDYKATKIYNSTDLLKDGIINDKIG